MLVVGLCASIVIGLAAQTSSEIRGVITDQQGLPVSRATVVIVADETGSGVTLTTGPDGQYRALGLPPGEYTVTASYEGLSTSAAFHLNVPLNRQVTLDVVLTVSSHQEQITVNASLVETSTPATGRRIAPKEVASMPLLDRNYLGLLQLVPGVAINRVASQG